MNSITAISIVGLGCILANATGPTATRDCFVRGRSTPCDPLVNGCQWRTRERRSAGAKPTLEEPGVAEIRSNSSGGNEFEITGRVARTVDPARPHVLEVRALAIEQHQVRYQWEQVPVMEHTV
jgi:hypothetical protein